MFKLIISCSPRKSKVTQSEVVGEVVDLNMYYYPCAYVYILPSVIHVCFQPQGHSQLLRSSLAHSRSHGSVSSPYTELGVGPERERRSVRKDLLELSERWRVHSAGRLWRREMTE